MSSAAPPSMQSGPESNSVVVPPEMSEALALIVRIGGPELLARVTTLFHASAVERLAAMRHAVGAGELTKLKRLAHAMKGSAAQIGAEPLRALAHELERNAEAMTLADASATVVSLGGIFESTFAQLESAGRQGVNA